MNQHQKNILAIYHQASRLDIQQGMNWYENAHMICSDLAIAYDYTISQVIGVMAAISPRMSWQQNVLKAEQTLQAHKIGLDYVKGVMKANLSKAMDILDGSQPLDVLGGNKVRSFYNNIFLRTNYVTIDTHAISIWYNERQPEKVTAKVFSKKKVYDAIASDYIIVAKSVGITPYQLQAITWVTWRRLKLNKVD